MNRILNFQQYFLREQEENTTPASRPETDREAKSRIAGSLVSTLLGNIQGLTGGIDSEIEITPEVKTGAPYSACGGSAFQLERKEFSVRFFKNLLRYLNEEKGIDHSRAIKELDEGRSLVVGMRNKISVKSISENNDKFTDALYLIESKAKDDDMVKPYQITTSPSLAYYGKKPLNPQGIGIKLPGDTLYNLGSHKMGHGTYVLMAEAEPIEVGRYPIGTVKYETYTPVDKFQKQYCGMQIHRSSTGSPSPCIGPWSAGCQVFSDIKEFNEFIERATKQTVNSNRFIYALVEVDSFNDAELVKNLGLDQSKEEARKRENKTEKQKKERLAKEDSAKKQKDSDIADLAALIRRESSSWGDTDEAAFIKKYNKVITSKKDFLALKSKYGGNVYDAMNSFLESTELSKLTYTI